MANSLATRSWARTHALPHRVVRGLAIFFFAAVCWKTQTDGQASVLRVIPPGSVSHGAADAVYTSLTAGMNALRPGDHLVIEAGTYRDTLSFPRRNWAITNKETVVEGVGRVVINGANMVDGWRPLGGGRFYVPAIQEPAQILVDDAQLQQIGGTVFDGYPSNPSSMWRSLDNEVGGIWPGRRAGNASTLPMNSFYFDREAQRIVIRVPFGALTSHKVEVSTRTYGALGEDLSRLTIRNLTFRLGNTSISSRAALVTLRGDHLLIENVRVTEADSVGMEVTGKDIRVSHVLADHCGQLGIKARGTRISIVDSETDFNNTRGFNKWWEAGGAKFVGDNGLQDSELVRHVAIGNLGDGIWFDWGNRNNRVSQSVSEYNSGMGIHYEASFAATIVDNVVIGNGQRGIYLPHSSESVVAFNLVAANGLQGITIIDERRHDPEGVLDLRPKANSIVGNVVAWNGGALVLPQKLDHILSDANVFIGTSPDPLFALGWHSKSFASLAAWRSDTGQDEHSVFMQRAEDATLMSAVAHKDRQIDFGWYEQLHAGFARIRESGMAQAGTVLDDRADLRPGPSSLPRL